MTVEQPSGARTKNWLNHGQLKRLELFSILEATTLATLVSVAVPLKYLYDWPLGSRILGPIHGIMFLAYCGTALHAVTAGGWKGPEILRLFVVAFLPFAGFFNIPWLRRKSKALVRQEVE